jgi:hypothetical protein
MSNPSLAVRVTVVLALWLWLGSSGCGGGDGGGVTNPTDTQSPTAEVTSPSGGASLTGTVTVQVNAQDNVGVAKVELLVDGGLTATDGAAPWDFSWNTDNLSAGAHSLSARAYDAAGNTGLSPSVNVTIQHAFVVTFNNHVFTPIVLNVDGVTKAVPALGSVTFTYQGNPGNINYSGTTSGKTTTGTPIGLTMSWLNTRSVAGMSSWTEDLILTPSYFFIYVNNCSVNGALTGPFYVNYGLVAQTQDNISIPSSCVNSPIGYYNAFTNTEVRAYRGLFFVFWDQGINFVLPFTNNQYVVLGNTL